MEKLSHRITQSKKSHHSTNILSCERIESYERLERWLSSSEMLPHRTWVQFPGVTHPQTTTSTPIIGVQWPLLAFTGSLYMVHTNSHRCACMRVHTQAYTYTKYIFKRVIWKGGIVWDHCNNQLRGWEDKTWSTGPRDVCFPSVKEGTEDSSSWCLTYDPRPDERSMALELGRVPFVVLPFTGKWNSFKICCTFPMGKVGMTTAGASQGCSEDLRSKHMENT